MPYVSISDIPEDRLAFFGHEKMAEVDEFLIYSDRDGRLSVTPKDNPYIWVDDISDAIQMGSKSIVTLSPPSST